MNANGTGEHKTHTRSVFDVNVRSIGYVGVMAFDNVGQRGFSFTVISPKQYEHILNTALVLLKTTLIFPCAMVCKMEPILINQRFFYEVDT